MLSRLSSLSSLYWGPSLWPCVCMRSWSLLGLELVWMMFSSCWHGYVHHRDSPAPMLWHCIEFQTNITSSQVFSVGLTATVATQRFGWDLHIWDVPLTAQVTGRKLSWCGQIFYTVAGNLAKTSILVFYLRILVARVDKIITKLALAGVVGYFISIIFVVFLQCRYVSPPRHLHTP